MSNQREIKEGDKGRAIHPGLGQVVEVVYLRRQAHLKSEDVEVLTLLGVHLETDEVLVIPHQSVPDIAAAIKAKAARAALAATTSTTSPPSAHV